LKTESSGQYAVHNRHLKDALHILAGLDDNRVAIISAWAGSETVTLENMQEQTELKKPVQNLPIIEDGKVGNKRILRLQLSNKELNSGYTLNQLGIFVSVDGGEPILYFLAQNETGDAIPSKEIVPGFLAEYITTLVFSARSDVAVECSESVFVTHDALDTKIEVLLQNAESVFVTHDAFDSEIAKIELLLQNAQKPDCALITVSPESPENPREKDHWFDTSDGQSGQNPANFNSVIIANAVVSETEPTGEEKIWVKT